MFKKLVKSDYKLISLGKIPTGFWNLAGLAPVKPQKH